MKKYDIAKPYLSNNEIKAVTKTLKSGWITSGPKTNELEELIKKKINVKHVIAVN